MLYHRLVSGTIVFPKKIPICEIPEPKSYQKLKGVPHRGLWCQGGSLSKKCMDFMQNKKPLTMPFMGPMIFLGPKQFIKPFIVLLHPFLLVKKQVFSSITLYWEIL